MNNFKKTIVAYTPKQVMSFYHLMMGWLGNLIYSYPARNLHLIGVTGTKGKTTVAFFIHQLLNQDKKRTALSSTVYISKEDKLIPNPTKMGMPGRFFLPRFLRKSVNEGNNYAVVETTSEGIVQHRHRFLDYKTAVYTGLAPEHLERHGGFAAYRKAKEKLFQKCTQTHILNLEDKHVKHFLAYPANSKWGILINDKKKLTNLSKILPSQKLIPSQVLEAQLLKNEVKLIEYRVQKSGNSKIEIKLIHDTKFKLPFLGKFNLTNLLLALATARSIGIPFATLPVYISQLTLPPGRMEELDIPSLKFRIFLDYAHEPLSLRSSLKALKSILPKGKKLICLTGSQGGGRDKWKRKIMGQIAVKYADKIVIATEDPYEEDPQKINQEVLNGVLENKKFKENVNVWSFEDRFQAIKHALNIAEGKDIVLLAGKGGESKMCIGEKIIDWNEKEETLRATKEL